MRFVQAWALHDYFAAEISFEAFRALLAQLRDGPLAEISPDPADYRVTEFGVLGEIFPGTGRGNEVSLAASVVGLELGIATRHVPAAIFRAGERGSRAGRSR
jgi:hypothetical protein